MLIWIPSLYIQRFSKILLSLCRIVQFHLSDLKICKTVENFMNGLANLNAEDLALCKSFLCVVMQAVPVRDSLWCILTSMHGKTSLDLVSMSAAEQNLECKDFGLVAESSSTFSVKIGNGARVSISTPMGFCQHLHSVPCRASLQAPQSIILHFCACFGCAVCDSCVCYSFLSCSTSPDHFLIPKVAVKQWPVASFQNQSEVKTSNQR